MDARSPDLVHVVWDPTNEPRPGIESSVLVDEPATLSSEEYLSDIPESGGTAGASTYAGRARGSLEYGVGETSSNPSHGVPETFRSPTSFDSISAQSIQSVATGPATEGNSSGAHHEGRSRSSSSLTPQVAEGLLPADDGMGILRKRILEIQNADAPPAEKSRSMHALMTERYSLSHPSLHFPRPRSKSPASFSSADRPITPRSNHSHDPANLAASPPTSLSSVANAPDPFNLSSEDLKPTYYSKPLSSSICQDSDDRLVESDNDIGEPMEDAKSFGCAHYKRNIKLQCSACDGWYTCRFCHDQVEDHSLNRRETKHMLCMFCGCAQKASHVCMKCGETAAWYYCDVCKLWDDDPRRNIYHCHDCGICRVGQGLGKDFFHCKVSRFHAHS